MEALSTSRKKLKSSHSWKFFKIQIKIGVLKICIKTKLLVYKLLPEKRHY